MARRPTESRKPAAPWWRPTLTNGKSDWREYLAWQIGLLVTALSLLYVLMLFPELPVPDVTPYDAGILLSLLADAAACGILWYLIDRDWSRSKRFVLGFMILADIFAKLVFLRALQPEVFPFDSLGYSLLLYGTGLYLLGTAVVGMIVWIRGD